MRGGERGDLSVHTDDPQTVFGVGQSKRAPELLWPYVMLTGAPRAAGGQREALPCPECLKNKCDNNVFSTKSDFFFSSVCKAINFLLSRVSATLIFFNLVIFSVDQLTDYQQTQAEEEISIQPLRSRENPVIQSCCRLPHQNSSLSINK